MALSLTRFRRTALALRSARRLGATLSLALALTVLLAGSLAQPAHAAARKDFRVAWTIYAGWMPWPYAQQAGIVEKSTTSTASTSSWCR
jgi:NitT/TauT family transport system substrate-binding protein